MHLFLDTITKKYFQFSGRASRKEYWMFVLVFCMVSLVIESVFAYALFSRYGSSAAMTLTIFFFSFVFLHFLAVYIRRLHDIGVSGWWSLPIAGFWLVASIPLFLMLSLLILIVLGLIKGTLDDNKYGPNPKGIAAASSPISTVPVPQPPVAPQNIDSTPSQS